MTAIFSGILLALSFPVRANGISFWWGELAWIALVPLYLFIRSSPSPRWVIVCSFVTGLLFYAISLYWIFIALHLHGEVSVGPSLLALAVLVTILSIFLTLALSAAGFLSQRGIPLSIGFPILWVLQDFARNFIPFGGFSWNSLAYSQDSLKILQVADLAGPYGITFFILLTNALFGEVILFLRKKRGPPRTLGAMFAMGLIFMISYGTWRISWIEKQFSSLPEKKILLVQGNVAQEMKWVSDRMEEILQGHVKLTQKAEAEFKPDLILWPEASYPAVMPPEVTRVGIIDRLKTPLLMGVVSYDGVLPDLWPPPADWFFRLHNSAFLIEPGGIIGGRYHKNHLVPMGEYVPMKRVLFFLEKIAPGYVDFASGDGFRLLETDGMKIGVTICYEDLFPEIARAFVKNGAGLLVNLTNDAWYERSSAIDQHVAFSRFRAIENRRYLARATNTGVTAVFDPVGREIARAPLFQEAVLPATIRLGGPTSFYTRFGDLFIGICLLTLFGTFFLSRNRSIEKNSFALQGFSK